MHHLYTILLLSGALQVVGVLGSHMAGRHGEDNCYNTAALP